MARGGAVRGAGAIRRIARWLGDAYLHVRFPHAGFRGVYATFDAAVRDAPRSKRIGYDHRDVALGYRKELDHGLAAFDRPVISHLRQAPTSGCTTSPIASTSPWTTCAGSFGTCHRWCAWVATAFPGSKI